MVDVFVYLVDMPFDVGETVVPCADGNYTVYLNARHSDSDRMRAYRHAMYHIKNNDFEKENVQEIESKAHENH